MKGRKRHILVDTLGLVHRVVVHAADIQYQERAKEQGFLLQSVLRPARVKGFVILPKRWIVERTHAWVGNSRRHRKDSEHQTKSSEAMILIAMTRTMLKYCHNNNL